MKTNQLPHFILATGITLALAATFAFSAGAADQLKGGQLQIGERPAQVQALPPLDLTTSKVACPSCTNSVTSYATSAGRGAFVKSGVIVTHECPACKTTIATVGAGKAKTDVAVHTCAGGAVAACCGGMKM